ncbi:hypothetical protein [Dyella lutea]|uniref:Uncharacterized protein n=1 Tax=Dyella lutea TaxID=2950441 RepID=A0ABT1F9Z6_9GAMM|nr:hypothetical protein [Dyella lutea]MCP1374187.1 hypothetical protein [Dyella lutea]
MKKPMIIVGLMSLLVGLGRCFALVRDFSASSITSAYSAGIFSGRAFVVLVFIAAGVTLIRRAMSVGMAKSSEPNQSSEADGSAAAQLQR